MQGKSLMKEDVAMEKLTWGMIGAGDVTELKNGPGLYENDNCQLKAITTVTNDLSCF